MKTEDMMVGLGVGLGVGFGVLIAKVVSTTFSSIFLKRIWAFMMVKDNR